MPKKVKRTSGRKYKKSDDRMLMLLAGSAAILVGFFAIFAYKNNSIANIPTPTPKTSVTASFNAQNGSGETGMASLIELNGKLLVTLNMVGFPQGVSQPAHIHLGSCPNPGIVEYPLTNVLNGKSTTTLNITMDKLRSLGKLSVNVHKSGTEAGTFYSCANLNL